MALCIRARTRLTLLDGCVAGGCWLGVAAFGVLFVWGVDGLLFCWLPCGFTAEEGSVHNGMQASSAEESMG
jgi:hypothetical protein